MPGKKTFARFFSAPENRAAFLAMQDLAERIKQNDSREPNLIFLHGPAGTGKSYLVLALINETAGLGSQRIVTAMEAETIKPPSHQVEVKTVSGGSEVFPEQTLNSDLFIVEDLQYLPPRGWEALVQVIDNRQARQLPMVFTSLLGPGSLEYRGEGFPKRLTSRLASGLVVGLEPLHRNSRIKFLEEIAQRKQLALGRDILSWVGEQFKGGCRQLAGAVNQLEQLARLERRPLDLKTVTGTLGAQIGGSRPAMERIASRVSDHFEVAPRQLQSQRRSRHILLPRQVGMYLAHRLTELSLEQIGAYFGGRDHSTVLHACRKVAGAIQRDAVLCRAVRQLHADLA